MARNSPGRSLPLVALEGSRSGSQRNDKLDQGTASDAGVELWVEIALIALTLGRQPFISIQQRRRAPPEGMSAQDNNAVRIPKIQVLEISKVEAANNSSTDSLRVVRPCSNE